MAFTRKGRRVGKRRNSREKTIKKRETFLTELRQSGNVAAAARKAGMSTSTAYRMAKNPDFSEAFEAARTEGEEALAYRLLEEARRRAEDGVERPVFYQGKVCGTIREYSDLLLMFKIKGLMPKFRDNFPAIDIHASGPSSIRIYLDDGPNPLHPANVDGPQSEIDVAPDNAQGQGSGSTNLSVEE